MYIVLQDYNNPKYLFFSKLATKQKIDSHCRYKTNSPGVCILSGHTYLEFQGHKKCFYIDILLAILRLREREREAAV